MMVRCHFRVLTRARRRIRRARLERVVAMEASLSFWATPGENKEGILTMGKSFQNYGKFRKQTNHKLCRNARKIWTQPIRKWRI
ncbi:hypothetical protein CDI09_15595 [Komagataeibacter nataicola]|uniref:Uncharacterized protein n=1 Tax=Komagataeibacter nataicola TaxID=265960 RepID=A0ABX5PCL7_9PROT|nr:hypothetical protein CDI09_15595 [Komagataeibacter nataicola]